MHRPRCDCRKSIAAFRHNVGTKMIVPTLFTVPAVNRNETLIHAVDACHSPINLCDSKLESSSRYIFLMIQRSSDEI